MKKYKLMHGIEYSDDDIPYTKFPLTNYTNTLVDEDDIHIIEGLNIKHRGRYAVVFYRSGENKKPEYLHRIITSCPPGLVVDHINGDGLDNRRANLRVCSYAENLRNAFKTKRATSSQFKGVCWNKSSKRWQANIYIESRLRHLGNFNDEREAALAYNLAATKHFGEFARVNSVSPFLPKPSKTRKRRG